MLRRIKLRRESDWANSKLVMVLDLLWNIAFVMVSISVLIISRYEMPSTLLRLWVVGYALQCLLHMVCVCVEYKKRRQQRYLMGDSGWRSGGSNHGGRWNSGHSSSGSGGGESGDYGSGRRNDEETSVAKHLESANTMFLFIWWIMGFYWVAAGGPNLTHHDSPQLYWLCITFLAFDVFLLPQKL